MGLFRRREPLHEKLAREGGLTTPDLDPRPQWQETGVHGIARPREWDVTATVDAPGIEGDTVEFIALPGKPSPFDIPLEPPYRGRAVRQSGTLWAVQARRIRVVEIPDGPEGDTIELISTPDGTTLSIDDSRAFGTIPELEGLGDVVHATRIEGDLWEIRVSNL